MRPLSGEVLLTITSKVPKSALFKQTARWGAFEECPRRQNVNLPRSRDPGLPIEQNGAGVHSVLRRLRWRRRPSLERFGPNHGTSVRPRLHRGVRKPVNPAAGTSPATARAPNADAAYRKPRRRPLPIQRFWAILGALPRVTRPQAPSAGRNAVGLDAPEDGANIDPRGETAWSVDCL